MLSDSHAVVSGLDVEQKDTQIIVYEGFLTKLITVDLSLSVPYYTSVRKALMNMGCIRQLRRGGSTSPSQWEMCFEPNEQLFLSQQPKKIPKTDKYSAMEARIDELTHNLSGLTTTVEELITAWAREFGAKEVKQ